MSTIVAVTYYLDLKTDSNIPFYFFHVFLFLSHIFSSIANFQALSYLQTHLLRIIYTYQFTTADKNTNEILEVFRILRKNECVDETLKCRSIHLLGYFYCKRFFFLFSFLSSLVCVFNTELLFTLIIIKTKQ